MFLFVVRLGCYPFVAAAHMSSGLSAKEWVEFVIARVGSGKGGGKADTANASFGYTEALCEQVYSAATAFVKDKFSVLTA